LLIHGAPRRPACSLRCAGAVVAPRTTPVLVIVRWLTAKIDKMILAEIGRQLGMIVRVALRAVRRSRRGAALLHGFRVMAVSLGHVVHQLWLEVTGFTFLVLAAIGGMAGFRELAKLHSAQPVSPIRFLIAAAFTLCFAWFGLSSFWRAHRNEANRRVSASPLGNNPEAR
jgi:hypothetical protein